MSNVVDLRGKPLEGEIIKAARTVVVFDDEGCEIFELPIDLTGKGLWPSARDLSGVKNALHTALKSIESWEAALSHSATIARDASAGKVEAQAAPAIPADHMGRR